MVLPDTVGRFADCKNRGAINSVSVGREQPLDRMSRPEDPDDEETTCLAGTRRGIVSGVGVAPSLTQAQPAAAIDSISDLCASLNHKSASYKKCVEQAARAHKPVKGEIECYKGAGLAMGAMLADAWISKAEAKTLAARLLAAGAFGCIGAWIL
jgi:hypothetical protein